MFSVKQSTKNIGNEGEDIAAEYLIKKGYRILTRNYRTKIGEFDIITKKSGKITFIEVKTIRQLPNNIRQSTGESGNYAKLNQANDVAEYDYLPEDHLDTKKIMKLRKLAQMFAAKHYDLISDDIGYQIDLIAIELFNVKQFNLRHYENI